MVPNSQKKTGANALKTFEEPNPERPYDPELDLPPGWNPPPSPHPLENLFEAPKTDDDN
jgi:hypothetical protein